MTYAMRRCIYLENEILFILPEIKKDAFWPTIKCALQRPYNENTLVGNIMYPAQREIHTQSPPPSFPWNKNRNNTL